MTRRSWLGLFPSLLVGGGIIAATFVAVRAAGSGWFVLAAPLLLALAVLGADVLNSRLRGEPSGPSWAAWISGGAILLASVIVALRDPSLVKTLIPVVGGAGWVTLLARPERRREACGNS